MPNTVPNVLTTEILMKSSGLLLKNLGLTFPSLGVNKDNLDKVLEMDTTQFIGVSDDGLYFTKKGNLLADSPDTMEKLFLIVNRL
jgi:dihydroorotase